MWKKVLNVVFPADETPQQCLKIKSPFCALCGEPVSGEVSSAFTCSNCHGRVWHIHQARAAYQAEKDVLDWIHWCKYRSQWHRLPQLAEWLIEGYDQHFAAEPPDAVVPVPLHWKRFWRRGFNQAAELARLLSRQRHIPMYAVLKRCENTQVQASLTRKQRINNCRRAFTMKKWAFDVSGKRLLLIDDVFTTGSTVNACARQLKKAGAESVSVLTVARGGNF